MIFSQIENLAYFSQRLDLLMRGAFGYGLPNDMGPVLGYVPTQTSCHSNFFKLIIIHLAHCL